MVGEDHDGADLAVANRARCAECYQKCYQNLTIFGAGRLDCRLILIELSAIRRVSECYEKVTTALEMSCRVTGCGFESRALRSLD